MLEGRERSINIITNDRILIVQVGICTKENSKQIETPIGCRKG